MKIEGLSIGYLQQRHFERQKEWCPDQQPDLSFRGNEMGGECGEAQNVIKKLERERHGWAGSRDTVEHLGEELADVIHTATLCAITAGIDLEPYVVATFNAKSDEHGLRTRLTCKAEAPADTPPKTCADAAAEVPFKVGDVVQLKSGGATMTVSAADCCTVECVFMDRWKELKVEELPLRCLRLADETDDALPF